MRRRRVLISVLGLLLALPLTSPARADSTATPTPPPKPPTQPASGPGGADYAYDEVTAAQYGAPPNDFWVYEPASPRAPATEPGASLPVVLVLPGWGDTSPRPLQSWIDHLVRRGAIVVFANYQRGNEPIPATPGPVLAPAEQQNLRTTLRAAVAELAAGTRTPPDLGRVAVVGTSFGGTLALFYAATAAADGLPVPRAVMDVQGGCAQCPEAHLAPLQAVPAEALVLVVAGGDDTHPLVGDDPKRMFGRLTAVPPANRDFVTIHHGRPALRADHGFYVSPPLDALDWYGTWKLFDALTACAFAGEWCEVALGDTPAQRFMGLWSDGVPVAEAVVTDDPGTPTP